MACSTWLYFVFIIALAHQHLVFVFPFLFFISYFSFLISLGLPFRSRRRTYRKFTKLSMEIFEISRQRDHGGIIGTVLKSGNKGLPVVFLSQLGKCFAQSAVGRYATGNAQLVDARCKGGGFQFIQ